MLCCLLPISLCCDARFPPLLVIIHSPCGSWTHGTTSSSLLWEEEIPFELNLIGTVILVFGNNSIYMCTYRCICNPDLLNASTLLWIDGFVFPSQNNGLQLTFSIWLILQSINSRWSCDHRFCIPNISNKNLENIQYYQLKVHGIHKENDTNNNQKQN